MIALLIGVAVLTVVFLFVQALNWTTTNEEVDEMVDEAKDLAAEGMGCDRDEVKEDVMDIVKVFSGVIGSISFVVGGTIAFAMNVDNVFAHIDSFLALVQMAVK